MAPRTHYPVIIIVLLCAAYKTERPFNLVIYRYFAPWVGIPEDPVTGSAHTVLTPYWAQALNDKNKLFARQSSPRGGELELELKSDHIAIRGQGTIVLRGSIAV